MVVSARTPPRPLGLRAQVSLTEQQRQSLQILEAYDLGAVRSRLLRQGAMPSTWVDEAILEFRRYLGLRVLSPEPPAMLSKPVDEVWHASLLFSRTYADMCEQVFGFFVHHEPAAGVDPDPAATWQRFVDAYRAAYGEPGRLWQMGHSHTS